MNKTLSDTLIHSPLTLRISVLSNHDIPTANDYNKNDETQPEHGDQNHHISTRQIHQESATLVELVAIDDHEGQHLLAYTDGIFGIRRSEMNLIFSSLR